MQRNRSRLGWTLYMTAALWLMLIPAAHAYLDAGSTTVMFQAIVAGLAAGGMFFKLYWRKVKAFFFRRTLDAEAAEAAAAETTDAPVAEATGALDQ